MSHYPQVLLKPHKETPILAGHPWVFSNAIDKEPHNLQLGAVVQVLTSNKRPLGLGTLNPLTDIRIRMFPLGARMIDSHYLSARLADLEIRKLKHLPPHTNAYRIAQADADGLPGLILDRYNNAIVFQIHTAGMDLLRSELLEAIKQLWHPEIIVERSDLDVRKIEGLLDQPVTIHHGTAAEPVEITEASYHFLVDIHRGQKTGFFLDQRDARGITARLAKGKKVLNLFSYSGAFSVYSAKAGASTVTTVDLSKHALELAKQNFALNGLDPEDSTTYHFIQEDVFGYLNDLTVETADVDLLICDPPAFAKSRQHIDQALKAYLAVNRKCLSLLKPGGILITSSCSGRVSREEFRDTIRIAAGQAERDVRILHTLGHPSDHTEKLSFPEGSYLKTLVLEVI